ncbi:hypothetical protein RFI_23076, partial [Reticulomyxa filosa]
MVLMGEKSLRQIVLSTVFKKQKTKGKKSGNGKYEVSSAVIISKNGTVSRSNPFVLRFLQALKPEVDWNELSKAKTDVDGHRIPVMILNCNGILSSNLKVKNDKSANANGLELFQSLKSLSASQQVQSLKRMLVLLVYQPNDKHNPAKTKLSQESIRSAKQHVIDKIREV